MKINKYHRSGLTILVLIGLMAIGVAMGTSLAQQPEGSWPSVEVAFSPQEVPTGEAFLTTVTVRNEGTEPVTVDEVLVELPSGVDYVGQAFGSDVANPAEVSSAQLRWTGPFALPNAAELELRFWAIAGREVSPGQQPMHVTTLNQDDSPFSSKWTLVLIPGIEAETPPAPPSAVEKMAAEPSAVVIDKTAGSEEVDPGESVLYTVTFNNTGGSEVTLDTIRDVLPAGFKYAGLAYGSDIGDPPTDDVEPEIVWEGSWVVPAGGSKTLKYWAHVLPATPLSPPLYTNQVTASYGTTSVGPEYADVWVGEVPPAPPENVAASDGMFSDKVQVTWDEVEEATSYEVYRATSLGGDKDKLGDATGTSYDDTTASLGVTYYYWVTACGDSVCGDYSTPDTGYREGEGYWAYLPFVARSEGPVTTLPFVDTFVQPSADWVPFATPTGPYADQWIWGPAGYYWYDPNAGGHTWEDFALSMYQGAGATDWSDYQVVTRLRLRKDRLGGVWIRGTYQGGQLGGYYVHIQPRDNHVYLWRIPPGATRPDQALVMTKNDYGPNINIQQWYDLKVVAQGNNIKVWLKSASEPASEYRQIINWTDSNSTWMKGTVGFSAYKTFTVYDEIAVTAYP